MVHPKVKPGPRANYRQQLTFCPEGPAKSILVPAAEQQGPLRFEGSRSITPAVTGPPEKHYPLANRAIGGSVCTALLSDLNGAMSGEATVDPGYASFARSA
jgi:hypothetical protein